MLPAGKGIRVRSAAVSAGAVDSSRAAMGKKGLDGAGPSAENHCLFLTSMVPGWRSRMRPAGAAVTAQARVSALALRCSSFPSPQEIP